MVFYHANKPASGGGVAVVVADMECCLGEACVHRNSLLLKTVDSPSGLFCRVPLLDILDVWEACENEWAVKVSGWLELFPRNSPTTLGYRPMPR